MGKAVVVVSVGWDKRFLNIPFVSDKIKDGNHICYSIAGSDSNHRGGVFEGSTLLSKISSPKITVKAQFVFLSCPSTQLIQNVAFSYTSK